MVDLTLQSGPPLGRTAASKTSSCKRPLGFHTETNPPCLADLPAGHHPGNTPGSCTLTSANDRRRPDLSSLALKPPFDLTSCAAAHEQVPSYPTDTCASESPAITACA